MLPRYDTQLSCVCARICAYSNLGKHCAHRAHHWPRLISLAGTMWFVHRPEQRITAVNSLTLIRDGSARAVRQNAENQHKCVMLINSLTPQTKPKHTYAHAHAHVHAHQAHNIHETTTSTKHTPHIFDGTAAQSSFIRFESVPVVTEDNHMPYYTLIFHCPAGLLMIDSTIQSNIPRCMFVGSLQQTCTVMQLPQSSLLGLCPGWSVEETAGAA